MILFVFPDHIKHIEYISREERDDGFPTHKAPFVL